MIKNSKPWEAWEKERTKTEKLTYPQALRIFEGLWQEAKNLGALPCPNPLEGIEVDIKIARILNKCLKKS